ncbi:MAG: hypothetical protein OXH50_16060, partial [Gemmatimonadetes bacterium]|nr:hypothetical protein [Gemmatimonadota bacterium]
LRIGCRPLRIPESLEGLDYAGVRGDLDVLAIDPDLNRRLSSINRFPDSIEHGFQFYRRDDHPPTSDENPQFLGREPRFFRQLDPGEHLVDPDADPLDPARSSLRR